MAMASARSTIVVSSRAVRRHRDLGGPPARAGAGASVSETANELGIALGTALLGSIMTAVYRSRMELLDAVPDDALRRARETLGAAIVASEELSGAAGAALESGARSAFVEGVHTAAIVASCTSWRRSSASRSQAQSSSAAIATPQRTAPSALSPSALAPQKSATSSPRNACSSASPSACASPSMAAPSPMIARG